MECCRAFFRAWYCFLYPSNPSWSCFGMVGWKFSSPYPLCWLNCKLKDDRIRLQWGTNLRHKGGHKGEWEVLLHAWLLLTSQHTWSFQNTYPIDKRILSSPPQQVRPWCWSNGWQNTIRRRQTLETTLSFLQSPFITSLGSTKTE